MKGQASSSSHFVVSMVQLPDRAPLRPLVDLRKTLHLPSTFEFKFHKTTPVQKDQFFVEASNTFFRVRAAVVDKDRIHLNRRGSFSESLMRELITQLTLRASELDIANEILIVDGATRSYCRQLRVQLTEACKLDGRIRPFKKIIGANSRSEDGLQMADMIAGAIRLHAMGVSSNHFHCISDRIEDLWYVP